ncbi:probable pectinesterase 29 [Macadamia integrifolia]|uniref:probable pectinesterase 29 n=1 Tax=Macadamia integrifolia TaxID=60698 RepID=UPI001C5003E6|nr:probable pectinesterase 29 [Macadamia integrifolia]
MWFLRSLAFVIFMVSCFMIGELSNAGPSPISKKITVSPSGDGDFRTITEAIEQGVPQNNNNWIQILVMPGIYNEEVKVPRDKPFIIIEGTGKDKTFVNWNGNIVFSDASIQVLASNFAAKQITFKNTYNHAIEKNDFERKPAVAASIEGDKIFFSDCGFIGVQDTIFDYSGRHYFQNCYIEGAVDFIFGNGQSIYEGCNINVTAGLTGATPGYLTAQRRDKPDESTGFVFKSCNILGTGPTYLGRAYGTYSRVIYYKCDISVSVVPEGWDAWESKGKENTITYVESGNTGPGSDTSKRVPWINKLSDDEVQKLVSMSFIDADGWLEGTPK